MGSQGRRAERGGRCLRGGPTPLQGPLSVSAGERPRQRNQCLLVAFVGDVSEVASNLQKHTLALGNRAHGFLSNAFVEIADRDADLARRLRRLEASILRQFASTKGRGLCREPVADVRRRWYLL